jgi:hypothetical protein
MGLNVALASIISNQEIRTERKRQIWVKPPCAEAKEWHETALATWVIRSKPSQFLLASVNMLSHEQL